MEQLRLKGLLYIICKDQASRALADISLIESSKDPIETSEEPIELSEEYIQTFIDQIIKDAHIFYSAGKHHIIIADNIPIESFTEDSFLQPSPVNESILNMQLESGFWIYRTSKDNDTVYHEFLYFGDTKKAYKDSIKHIKGYKKGLYNWIEHINTLSHTIKIWKREGRKWRLLK